jgi:hypothetical protein
MKWEYDISVSYRINPENNYTDTNEKVEKRHYCHMEAE